MGGSSDHVGAACDAKRGVQLIADGQLSSSAATACAWTSEARAWAERAAWPPRSRGRPGYMGAPAARDDCVYSEKGMLEAHQNVQSKKAHSVHGRR